MRCLLLALVPVAAVALLPAGTLPVSLSAAWLALALTAGVGIAALVARTAVERGLSVVGALAFGALYLGLPLAALAELQRRSPWLLFLLLAIVWIGDSAAYYIGTRFGRHRLAPVLSPKKSWEGAAAALAASLVSAIVWAWWREGAVDGVLVALAVATSIAAQLGDLVESMLKRGAGVKDSGTLLPGHGGFLDRLDAILFAAPVWWLALDAWGRLPGAP